MLVVADESGVFGEYLPYRTADARPVAGTQGLVPTSWHPRLSSGGDPIATLPAAGQPPDAAARLRCLGRGALGRRGGDARYRRRPAQLIAHLKSADFELAAFKDASSPIVPGTDSCASRS